MGNLILQSSGQYKTQYTKFDYRFFVERLGDTKYKIYMYPMTPINPDEYYNGFYDFHNGNSKCGDTNWYTFYLYVNTDEVMKVKLPLYSRHLDLGYYQEVDVLFFDPVIQEFDYVGNINNADLSMILNIGWSEPKFKLNCSSMNTSEFNNHFATLKDANFKYHKWSSDCDRYKDIDCDFNVDVYNFYSNLYIAKVEFINGKVNGHQSNIAFNKSFVRIQGKNYEADYGEIIPKDSSNGTGDFHSPMYICFTSNNPNSILNNKVRLVFRHETIESMYYESQEYKLETADTAPYGNVVGGSNFGYATTPPTIKINVYDKENDEMFVNIYQGGRSIKGPYTGLYNGSTVSFTVPDNEFKQAPLGVPQKLCATIQESADDKGLYNNVYFQYTKIEKYKISISDFDRDLGEKHYGFNLPPLKITANNSAANLKVSAYLEEKSPYRKVELPCDLTANNTYTVKIPQRIFDTIKDPLPNVYIKASGTDIYGQTSESIRKFYFEYKILPPPPYIAMDKLDNCQPNPFSVNLTLDAVNDSFKLDGYLNGSNFKHYDFNAPTKRSQQFKVDIDKDTFMKLPIDVDLKHENTLRFVITDKYNRTQEVEYKFRRIYPPRITFNCHEYNLGNKCDPFNCDVSIHSGGQAYTVFLYYNGSVIDTYNVDFMNTSEKELSIKIDKTLFDKFYYGQNTIILKTKDIYGTEMLQSDMSKIIFNKNHKPTISVNSTDLGDQSEIFNFDYTIEDKDNDVLTITEYCEGDLINTLYSIQSGSKLNFKLTKDQFDKIPLHKATLLIKVDDGKGGICQKEITFNKVKKYEVTLSDSDRDLGIKEGPFNIDIKATANLQTSDFLFNARADNKYNLIDGCNFLENYTYTLKLTQTIFDKLSEGVHHINISASGMSSDGQHAKASRTLLFTKKNPNTNPSISVSSTDLGDQSEIFNFDYTVEDKDNDTLTVTEYCEGEVINTFYNIQSGTKMNFKLTKDQFDKIPLHKVTLLIKVDDRKGGTCQKEITFNKIANSGIKTQIYKNLHYFSYMYYFKKENGHLQPSISKGDEIYNAMADFYFDLKISTYDNINYYINIDNIKNNISYKTPYTSGKCSFDVIGRSDNDRTGDSNISIMINHKSRFNDILRNFSTFNAYRFSGHGTNYYTKLNPISTHILLPNKEPLTSISITFGNYLTHYKKNNLTDIPNPNDLAEYYVCSFDLNSKPEISDSDRDLGTMHKGFTVNYKVTDKDNDKLNISERLDDKVIQTYSNVLSNSTQILNITDSIFNGLSLGQHKLSIFVDDGKETVGRYYTFTKVNTPPIISGEDGNLGDKSAGFDISYQVTDNEVDKMNITEKLDEETIKDYRDVDSGTTKYLTISDSKFKSLKIGEHKIQIVVGDGKLSTTRTYTFNKINHNPLISGKNENLGEKSSQFDINYSVTDSDGDTITITEYLNNEVINTDYSTQFVSGVKRTLTITDAMLSKLPFDKVISILIYVNDGKGGSNQREYRFTRVDSAPIISDYNRDLGTKGYAFTVPYEVTDKEGDRINIVEKLNGKEICSHPNVTTGSKYSVNITNDMLATLPLNKTNTITINADDGKGKSNVREFTFIRGSEPPRIEVTEKVYPTIKFKVSNKLNTISKVVIELNNNVKHTYNSNFNNLSYNIKLEELTNKVNVLKITATDKDNLSTTKILNINKNTLTTPKVDDKIVVKGKEYSIESVTPDGLNMQLTLRSNLQSEIKQGEEIELINGSCRIYITTDKHPDYALLVYKGREDLKNGYVEEKYQAECPGRIVNTRIDLEGDITISQIREAFNYFNK